MENIEQKVLEAIVAHISGDSTEREKRIIKDWLAEDEENENILLYLSMVGHKGDRFEGERKKERIFSQVTSKISIRLLKKNLRLYKFLAAASIILLLALGSKLLFRHDTINYIETSVPFGARSSLVLSDSSVINLNAGSVLRYPAKFGKKQRQVELTGEGFFEVTRDPDRPFTVKTRIADIEVLGTSFNVKAYDDDDNFVTTLIEGSVHIDNICGISEGINLLPDQQAIINTKDNSLTVNKVDAILTASWKDNRLYFEREKFDDIVRELERYANTHIIIDSEELKNEVFSGIFDRGETIWQILAIFKKSIDIEYTEADGIITITEKQPIINDTTNPKP